ncbi:hypothetical protein E2C01_052168 [Portunus trituberculatus]|uniref:Uncharacterized protein n=1 Tax=Portunus trituberculatus TaxID=210409 RepID=A0A5B7GL51_PORTR|nr:hypothetical protein [Portunus trituberculatus]
MARDAGEWGTKGGGAAGRLLHPEQQQHPSSSSFSSSSQQAGPSSLLSHSIPHRPTVLNGLLMARPPPSPSPFLPSLLSQFL